MIKKKFSQLSDEQLEKCYNEILEYEKYGKLENSLVRSIRKEIADSFRSTHWDSDCKSVVIPEILMEIAHRHFNK